MDEIASDLWEQQMDDASSGIKDESTAQEVLVRLAAGIPADIGWRLDQLGRSKGRANVMTQLRTNGWKRNAAWVLSGMLALFAVASGFGMAIGMEDTSLAVKVAYGVAAIISGLLIVSGHLIILSRPWLGVAMVLAGAVFVSLIFWWLFFVVPLAAVLVSWFAIVRARTTVRGRGAPPSMSAGRPA
jgi:hypothetical protein